MNLRGRFTGLSLLLTASLSTAPTACGGTAPGWAVVEVSSSNLPVEEAALERDLQTRGGSAGTYARLAAVKLAQKQPVAAAALARRALALDGTHTGALVISARVAGATGDAARAAALYGRAAELEPGNTSGIAREWGDALVALARSRAEAGRAAGVVELVGILETRLPERAAALREVRAALYLAAAEIHVKNGAGEQASAALSKARSAGAAPDATAFVEACTRVLGDGDPATRSAEARRLFERWAAASQPVTRWVRVGEFLASRGLDDDARWALAQAAAKAAATSDEALRVARLALRLGAVDEAAASIEAGAALASAGPNGDPARAELLREGAELLRRAGHQATAVRLYEAALTAAPGEPTALRDYTDYLASVGRWDDLHAVALRHGPPALRDPAAAEALAALLAKDDRAPRAAATLSRLAEDPAAPPALRFHLAVVAKRAGDPAGLARAMADLERRSGVAPEGLVASGRAWWLLGDYPKARALAEQALAAAPESPGPALLMADLHRATGDARREASVLHTLLQRASDRHEAALEVGRRFAGLTRDGHEAEGRLALQHLQEAASAPSPAVRAEAHRELFELSLRRPLSNYVAAADHMRAWLDLIEPAERPAALDLLARRTVGVAALADLRAEVLDALVALRPDDAATSAELGDLYLQLGQRTRAREAFERVVRLEGSGSAERLGDKLLARGFEDEALAFFTMVEPEDVSATATHRKLGDLFARRGDTVRANRHYRLFMTRAAAGETRNLRELRTFGEHMLTSGHRPDLAAQTFELLIAQQPGERALHLLMGRAHLELGAHAEARDAIDRWLDSAGPRRARDGAEAARTYFNAGAWSDAARMYEAALAEERPGWNSEPFARLAEIRRKTGDAEGLVRAAKLLIQRSQGKDRATATAAMALEEAGLLEEARALLAERLPAGVGQGAGPGPRPARQMGDASHLLDHAAENAFLRRAPAEALELMKAVLVARGFRREEVAAAANRLIFHGFMAEAERLLDDVVVANPEAPAAWLAPVASGWVVEPEWLVLRGRVRLARGDAAGAQEDFTAAMMKSPNPGDLVEQAVRHLRAAHQTDLAIELLSRAANAGGRGDHWLALGELEAARGDATEARLAFQRYLSQSERGHLKVAVAWAAAGYAADALTHFERAYEHGGAEDAEAALRGAAALLVAAGRTEVLDAHVRRFLLGARDAARAFTTVAQVWVDAGQPARAIPWLERSLELRPEPERRRQLAFALYGVGRDDAARAALVHYLAQRGDELLSRLGTQGPSARTHADDAADRVLPWFVDTARHGEGLAVFRAARRRVGAIPTYLAAEAHLLVLEGAVAEALDLVRQERDRFAKLRPVDVFAIASALADRERVAEALELLAVAMPPAPRNPTPEWRALAKLRLVLEARRGDVEAVERAADELLHGLGPEAHITVAEALYEEGLVGLAEAHADLALASPRKREAVEPALVGLAAARARGLTGSALASAVDALVARAASQPDRVEAATNEALLRFEAGQFAEAAAAAERGLALEPSSPDLLRLLERAVAVGAAGDPDELPDTLARRLSLIGARGRPRAQALRATLDELAAGFRPKLALAVADELLALDRGDGAVALVALELALQAGDTERAAALATDLAERAGRSPELLVELADRLDERLHPELAAPWLEATRDVAGPLAARRQKVLTRQALRAGDAAAAEAAADDWVRLAPDPGLARLDAAALVEQWSGPPSLTLSLVAPLVAAADRPPEALHLAAQGAWRAGDSPRARAWFAEWEARPSGRAHVVHPFQAARAAALAGDVESFVRVVDGPASLVALPQPTSGSGDRPRSSRPQLGVRRAVEVLDDLGDRLDPDLRARLAEAAERRLAEVGATAHPSDPWLTSAWWTVSLARGDVGAAVAAYEAAMARRPAAAGPANDLAYNLSVARRDLGRAAQLIRTAQARSLRLLSSFEDTAGWILFQQGRFAEARRLIERALRLSGRELDRGSPAAYAELLYHLGEAALATKDTAAAGAAFRDCAWRAPGSRYGERCLARLAEPALR